MDEKILEELMKISLEDKNDINNSLFEPYNDSEFYCPICGCKAKVKDAYVFPQIEKKEKRGSTYLSDVSTYKSRVYKETYDVQYNNIRICNNCHRKRALINLIPSIIVLVLGLTLSIISIVNQGFSFSFIGILLGTIFFALIVLAVFSKIDPYEKIDISKARTGNAIAPKTSADKDILNLYM